MNVQFYIRALMVTTLCFICAHVLQILVKHGALVAMANKYGDTPLSKARPRLRKKLEGVHSILQPVPMCLHNNRTIYLSLLQLWPQSWVKV